MTNETERAQAQCCAQAMRAAAIRVAMRRAPGESDPNLVYGCVDWFRYDAMPQPQATAGCDAAGGEATQPH